MQRLVKTEVKLAGTTDFKANSRASESLGVSNFKIPYRTSLIARGLISQIPRPKVSSNREPLLRWKLSIVELLIKILCFVRKEHINQLI